METRIDRNLIERPDGRIQLANPEQGNAFLLQLGLVLTGFLFVMDPLIVFLDDSIASIKDLLTGPIEKVGIIYLLHLAPILSIAMWLITKPVKISFDRKARVVLVESPKEELRYPWETIRFNSNFVPTKLGGLQRLYIAAGPPFPEPILIKHARRLAKESQQNFLVRVASFDCRDGDEAHAYAKFFKALMETDAPAMEIFRNTVARAQ